MFELKDPEALQYVSDYKLNLLSLREVDNPDKFSTNMKYVVSFIKAGKDKREIQKLIEDNKEIFCDFEEDAAMVIKEYTGVNVEKNKKKKTVNLCKGLQDWAEDERRIGREEGREEALIGIYYKGFISKELALSELNMSDKKFDERLQSKQG